MKQHCVCCGSRKASKTNTEYGLFYMCESCSNGYELYDLESGGYDKSKNKKRFILEKLQQTQLSFENRPKECAVCHSSLNVDLLCSCDVCHRLVCPITCGHNFEEDLKYHFPVELRKYLPTESRGYHTPHICHTCMTEIFHKAAKKVEDCPKLINVDFGEYDTLNKEFKDIIRKRFQGETKPLETLDAPEAIRCFKVSTRHLSSKDEELLELKQKGKEDSPDFNPLSVFIGNFGYMVYLSSDIGDGPDWRDVAHLLKDFGYSCYFLSIFRKFWDYMTADPSGGCVKWVKGFSSYIHFDENGPIYTGHKVFK